MIVGMNANAKIWYGALGIGLMLTCGAVFGQTKPPSNQRGTSQPSSMTGPWWRTPLRERVGVDADQRKSLEDLWQKHRLRRIDLEAAAQKAQITLEPLWLANSPDEGKILTQIDRISQAQTEIRKDEIRMQLATRQILSPSQWHKLQESIPKTRGNEPPGRSNARRGPDGPPPSPRPGPPAR